LTSKFAFLEIFLKMLKSPHLVENWSGYVPLAHQQEALNDFLNAEFLARGKDPKNGVWAKQKFLGPNFKGTITFSGAVGAGKTTLLFRLMAFFGDMQPTQSDDFWSLYESLHGDFAVFVMKDFSCYINKYLRDIPPSASFHAQVMYRTQVENLIDAAKKLTVPWIIFWDRWILENILFARSENVDCGLIFRDFWPTSEIVEELQKMAPKKVVMVAPLSKKENGFVLDNAVCETRVTLRDRCQFELDHAKDPSGWFYQSACWLYDKLGSEIIVFDSSGPYTEEVVMPLLTEIKSMLVYLCFFLNFLDF
jgi:hypothetical protein